MIIVLLEDGPTGYDELIVEMAESGFAHIRLDDVSPSGAEFTRLAFETLGSDFRIGLARDRLDPLRNEIVTGVAGLEEILALSRLAPTAVIDAGSILTKVGFKMLEAAHIPVAREFLPGEDGADSFRRTAILLATKLPRLAWDEYFMRIARVVAGRGDCVKRRVAAIIVRDRRIIATGYNGTPRGTTNCGQGGCPRCASFAQSGTRLGECLCSHGEENAIIQASYHGISVKGAALYSTCSPCLLCTKMIINSGIAEVVYNAAYPLGSRSLELLRESRVKVRRFKGD